MLEDAKAKGARVVNEGGGAVCETLFYPAVVFPVRQSMRLFREEQFGPILLDSIVLGHKSKFINTRFTF
jgi:glyceraldehyde-3-phosphate dehydrogenase (NADP+)